MNLRAYAAEFIGTFALLFAVVALGSASGMPFNPAAVAHWAAR